LNRHYFIWVEQQAEVKHREISIRRRSGWKISV